ASFDLAFLRTAMAPRGLAPRGSVVDTLGLARLLMPLARSHRLSQLTALLTLPRSQAHRALADARACGHLLLRLQTTAEQLNLSVLMELDRLLAAANWESRQVFSAALARVASNFPDRALGSRSPVPLPPADDDGAEADEEERPEFDPARTAHLLGPEGPLAQDFARYEHRPGQIAMAEAVGEALLEDRHLLVEAGTGTGKSLAYLLPTVLWARARGERVAVATHTINLQEQLWKKDLPLLREVLGTPFRAALVKGRSNYLCLRKHREIVEHEAGSLPVEELLFQARLVTWVQETQTGDRAELGLFGEEEEHWSRVASETETCLGPKCPFHARHCYYYRNRREAEEADILVANHSLVLADLGMGRQLLPKYSRLILDEAHHLEDTATKQWGLEVSQGALLRHLGGLAASGRRGGRRGRPGFLAQMKKSLRLDGSDGAEVREMLNQAGDQAKEALSAAEDVFDALTALGDRLGKRDDDGGSRTMRLRDEVRELAEYRPVDSARANLAARLRGLGRILGDLGARLTDSPVPTGLLDSLLLELDQYAAASYQYATDLDFILCAQGEGYVHWLELSRSAVLRAAPIQVGELLREKLFEPLSTVVLTSATLTVAGRFEHLRERLGLDGCQPDKAGQLAVPSPFRYDRQVLLCIPQGLPTPRDGEAIWAGAVEAGLLQLLRATQGQTLVLFTSHRMLRQVYDRLRPLLEEEGVTLLGQGIDGSRSHILEAFLANPHSVLFGASSFWEGVDVPGEALSCVVMVRLPFAPPGEPVTEARLEDLERRGLSSFEHLSLPQAVMRFRQGFGRLVRSGQDRGVVVVFDGRLGAGQARYASRFLQSLPGPALLRGPLESVVENVRQFLDESRAGRADAQGRANAG
ncbi:MAG: DEAD/DEAH box helicase family protein, partial [Firmicutes bacterium]|nr:DEAD/DEAH box helicase family protein [Bacillota bacterium]